MHERLILLIHSKLKCMHVCFNELRREVVRRRETFESMSLDVMRLVEEEAVAGWMVVSSHTVPK